MNYDSNKPYCGFDNINDLRSDLVEAFQEKKYKKLNAEAREQTEAQKEKEERTRRIENMAAQYDADESFKYDEDEARLNRNMVAFCSAAQLIDQDDIDEQNFFGGE